MSQEGFLTDLKTAMLFYRICSRYHVDHPEDRVLLLRELARRKRVRYLRDVEAVTIGKKVLWVGFKPKGDNK